MNIILSLSTPPLPTCAVAKAALMLFLGLTPSSQGKPPWQTLSGLPGEDGWSCHTIHPDPEDNGPDGINLHDWDGDGHLDVLSNAEEGAFSRLYFNPGPDQVRSVWNDYIEFAHGKCEDSGIGDLDGDGDPDYVANGGWVFFNPGPEQARDKSKWRRMTLFDHERRVPTVLDVDGDGLNDLIAGAQEWYRQPKKEKHVASNWTKFTIGENRWPMNCLQNDVDLDGDLDLVVPDRGVEVCWYENPGFGKIHQTWQRHQLHPHHEPMFMAVADLNGDDLSDFIITGGSKGAYANKLVILIRSGNDSTPRFKQVVLAQPEGSFPKGVTVLTSKDNMPPTIFVIPKQGSPWTATAQGNPEDAASWIVKAIKIPGDETRLKMDNAWQGDLDGDGDTDIVTTEENGGWGVIWFENPQIEGRQSNP